MGVGLRGQRPPSQSQSIECSRPFRSGHRGPGHYHVFSRFSLFLCFPPPAHLPFCFGEDERRGWHWAACTADPRQGCWVLWSWVKQSERGSLAAGIIRAFPMWGPKRLVRGLLTLLRPCLLFAVCPLSRPPIHWLPPCGLGPALWRSQAGELTPLWGAGFLKGHRCPWCRIWEL